MLQNHDMATDDEIRLLLEMTYEKKNGRKLPKRKKNKDLLTTEDLTKLDDMMMDKDLEFFVTPLETKRVKKNPGMSEKQEKQVIDVIEGVIVKYETD